MSTRTAVIFVGILAGIIALAFFVRPPTEGVIDAAGGDGAAVPAVVAVGSQATPILAPSPTAPPLPTPTAAAGQPVGPPSVTPLVYSAQQLQTFAPLSTLLPEDATATALAPEWRPPGLSVPIARSPWDHYWLIRPVASNFNNEGLGFYPYGANGDLDDLRIHHGVDFPNPIGVEIRAASDGTVIWADKGHFNDFESITAYGNCVVIQHDFGYKGQPVYTLYAHMSGIVAVKDQRVKSGDVIGLIGATGQVSGPHVHFEVRVGRDSYFSVRNPTLWMAPYVGTGTIAGSVLFPNRRTVNDATIILIDRETGRIVQRTTTYAGFGVNSDDYWKENFVFGDVPAGKYLVTSRNDNTTWSGEVEVVPGVTNWVNLERSTPLSTPAPPKKP